MIRILRKKGKRSMQINQRGAKAARKVPSRRLRSGQ